VHHEQHPCCQSGARPCSRQGPCMSLIARRRRVLAAPVPIHWGPAHRGVFQRGSDRVRTEATRKSRSPASRSDAVGEPSRREVAQSRRPKKPPMMLVQPGNAQPRCRWTSRLPATISSYLNAMLRLGRAAGRTACSRLFLMRASPWTDRGAGQPRLAEAEQAHHRQTTRSVAACSARGVIAIEAQADPSNGDLPVARDIEPSSEAGPVQQPESDRPDAPPKS